VTAPATAGTAGVSSTTLNFSPATTSPNPACDDEPSGSLTTTGSSSLPSNRRKSPMLTAPLAIQTFSPASRA
jgi:hypothetical protein